MGAGLLNRAILKEPRLIKRFMKTPPVNAPHLTEREWKGAQSYYRDYLSRYNLLVEHGLTDSEADEYIELGEKLEEALSTIFNVTDDEFFIDDLSRHFTDIHQLTNKAQELWEKLGDSRAG